MFCSKQVMIGASKNIWGFDPRTIPNCALWLDPADTSTVTLNGANVSQLNDKSGLGYNMSQSTAGNQPTYSTALNGNRMLTFTQASSTRLSNVSFPAFIGAGAASYFLVEYNMTGTGNPGPFGYSAGPNFGLIYQYNPGNVVGGTNFISGFQPFYDVTLYDVAFYSPVPRISYLTIPNTGSGMVGFINGVSRVVSTQTAGTYSGTFSVGSGTNGFISGNICELIVFNRSLTNSERQQIEGYLAQKWWVILPTSGFIPTSITGCQLWLDGSDRSTMTFSGANITQWRDKSGNARNTTSVVGTPILTSLNDVQAISFTGTSDFTGSIPGSGSALTVCIVGSRTAGAATNGGVVCFGRAGQPDWNDIRSLAITNGDTSLRVMLATRTANTQFAYIGSQAFMYILIFDGTNVNTFLNGGAIASPIANTETFAFTQYKIANRAGNTGNIRHTGTIGEVVVFNSALTVTQRQQMEGYLGNKWGLKTLIPVIQPYYSFRPRLQYFQPNNIAGLSVWFDAADMTTITGSSPVTAWRDKSGYRWNATTLIGTAPTLTTVNGNTAVSFAGSSTLTVSNVSFSSLIQSRAIFVVYRVPTSSANYISWFSTQANGINNQGGHNNLVIPTGGGGPYLQSFAVGGAVRGMGADPAVNTIGTTALAVMIHSAVSTASNVVTLNGTSYTLTTNTTASGYGVGTVTYYIGNAYPQPYILCEYIMYQREFTVGERQQVEAYLAWKWGITSSLPATHLYKTIPTALIIPPVVDPLSNAGSQDTFVVKYGSSGTPLWARRLGGTGVDFPGLASVDSSGNVIMIGDYGSNPLNIFAADGTTVSFTLANSGVNDVFVVKYDSSGTPLWARRLGGTSTDSINSVSVDSSGNIVVTGFYQSNPLNIFAANGSTVSFTLANSGTDNAFVVKYDSSGTPLWARRLGGTGTDLIRSVSVDSSGIIVVAGNYTSNPLNIFAANGSTVSFTLANSGTGDAFVVKYDSSGTPLWARRLGGTGNDAARSVSTDSSGNVIVTGDYGSNPLNIFAADGTTVSFTLANSGSQDSFVVKYDSSGTPLWARRLSGTSNEIILLVSVDSSGNIVVAGYYSSNPLNIFAADGTTVSFTLANSGGNDTFVVKYDSSGTPLWARRLGGTGADFPVSVSVDSSGNVIVTGDYQTNPLNIFAADGTTVSFTLANSGSQDSFVVKYDSSGTPLWARRLGGTGTDLIRSVSVDSSGNIVVAGYYSSNPLNIFAADGTTVSFTLANSGGNDAFVVKYDSSGTPLWARRLGGTGADRANSVSVDSSGNVIVTGDYISTSLSFY
jgi:hypothetical protein